VNGYEWSFGYCDQGTGVYPCPPKGNTGYTYRESVALGVTSLAPARVQGMMHVLQTQWPGHQVRLGCLRVSQIRHATVTAPR